MTARAKRLGMYGGAFDPPHLAHHALAQAAIEQHGLDALHVVPMGQAWYKRRNLTAAAHRLEMARLAFADLPAVHVDARETQRSGYSYTADTLRELQAQHPGAQLYLVMGQDQLEFFPKWQRFDEIMQIATLLVAKRSIESSATSVFSASEAVKIAHLDIVMPSLSHSSTQIRERASQGQDITPLVNSHVARYIAQHQLYS